VLAAPWDPVPGGGSGDRYSRPVTDDDTTAELEVTGFAVGGEGVARDGSGRVVFVAGALPGERVRAELVTQKRRFAKATAVEILTATEGRISPECTHAGHCGGCDMAHVLPARQVELKVGLVAEVLQRAGRVETPNVVAAPMLADRDFRTTVRAAVVQGRAGFRRARSHDVVTVDSCLVAHPLVEELLVEGRFGDATEVTIRVGAATGERLVLAEPSARGVVVPDDVTVVGADELKGGHRAWYHDELLGRRWRISAQSFFQSRAAATEQLVETVQAMVGDRASDGTLIDAYCGVGLFAGTVPSARTVAIERSASSVADARVNLADLDVRVVRSAVERWKPTAGDVVVADPSRQGLASGAAERLAATGASSLVLISCDAGSLGRDTARLSELGYHHQESVLVDSFTNTAHVEVVSHYLLSPDASPPQT